MYDVSMFIKENVLFNFNLQCENVISGYFNLDNLNNEALVINLLILFVRFHIHKCKFSNKKPFFIVVYKELENYVCTIQHSTTRKAIKAAHLCSTFKIVA